MKETFTKLLYLSIVTISLLGIINSSIALLAGFLFTFTLQTPFKSYSKKAIPLLLKLSIIGLGFGMFLIETLEASKDGFLLTVCSIGLTLGLGLLLVKALHLDKKLGHLIISGTAICGGSAISAISVVIKANSQIISVALGIIFILNSIALFIFPSIGHYLGLTQNQFGLWCAVAIHDTSSVVGSALEFGDEALKIATTIKLSRTLWIIPLSIFSSYLFKIKGEKIKFPFFIVLYIIAMLINSSHILPESFTNFIVLISKRILVLTLFLIGTSLSINELKSIGLKPILFATILWSFISIFSLVYILFLH